MGVTSTFDSTQVLHSFPRQMGFRVSRHSMVAAMLLQEVRPQDGDSARAILVSCVIAVIKMNATARQ
jgi:hypothetical protein